MFKTVEFNGRDDNAAAGEIAVVHKDWLTPRKGHCSWPPRKLKSKFNRCLVEGYIPDDSWEVFEIRRIFYESDDLTKGRAKAKIAEIDSEVNSDSIETCGRRRKVTRKIYDSDTSGDKSDDNDNFFYPAPPTSQIENRSNSNKALRICKSQEQVSLSKFQPLSKSGTSIDSNCAIDNTQKKISAVGLSTACNTTDGENYDKCQKQVPTTSTPTQNIEASVTLGSLNDVTLTPFLKELGPSSSGLGSLNDVTLTPFLKELGPSSSGLDVIAKHLARIKTDIKEIQISQHEILTRLQSNNPTTPHLPSGITLPCDDCEQLNLLETWILTEENGSLMVTHLSFSGGNKVPVIIRRILEKLFTNKLAMTCNWTGKNNKTALKDLKIVKIIRDATRANLIAAKTTDAEINEVITNWFRFTKDRHGDGKLAELISTDLSKRSRIRMLAKKTTQILDEINDFDFRNTNRELVTYGQNLDTSPSVVSNNKSSPLCTCDVSLNSSACTVRDPEDVLFSDSTHEPSNSVCVHSKPENMNSCLVSWSNKHNISHSALTALLKMLKPYHPNLPKDARTLLETPRSVNVVNCAGGSYIYFGLESQLRERALKGTTSKIYPFLQRKLSQSQTEFFFSP